MANLIQQPHWSGDSHGGLRVLIEAANWSERQALTQLLQHHGHQTVTCPGPEGSDEHCPLSDGVGCSAAAEADVVIHTLRPTDVRNRAVLLALQRHHPNTPLIAEVPAPRLAAHRGDYSACSVLESPVKAGVLLEALSAGGHGGRSVR